MKRITIVGETNPFGGDDEFALYPAPDGWMYRKDYLEAFERCNLVQGPWSMKAARQRVVELLKAGGKFILLGRKVCDGFGVPFAPFTVQDEVMLKLPHPSGLNRMWAEEGAFQRARDAVAAFAPEVAHLLGKALKESP